jgi:hypothetical protein
MKYKQKLFDYQGLRRKLKQKKTFGKSKGFKLIV